MRMGDIANPFGQSDIERELPPEWEAAHRWGESGLPPPQRSVADAYRMGGLAAMDQYRQAKPPTWSQSKDDPREAWKAIDAAAAERDVAPNQYLPPHMMTGQETPRVSQAHGALPDEAVEALRWHGLGDAVAGLAGASRAAQVVPNPWARAAIMAGGLMGGTMLMSEAQAAPRGPRGVPPWLAHPDQWWQGISANKLIKPMSEMVSEHVPSPSQVVRERFVSPEWFQGRGVFLPVPGDKSMAGERLVGVGGQRFDVPVELQGGHGFMAAQNPYVWASEQGVISTLAGRARNLAEQYPNVYLPFTGMGGQSVDFSHHMSDTLSEMVKNAQIIKRSKDPERMTAETFDMAMRNPITEGKGEKEKVVYRALEDWPGVLDPNLRQYLAEAPGKMRDKFAKVMATTPYQRGGFPNVAEARLAVSDPRLLYDTPLASGMSIARVDPGVIGPSGHRTYSTGIGGEYIGGFGQSIPATVMYPDIFKAYAAGKPLTPSQLDYAFRAGKPPFYQEANQEWLDGVMQYLGALRNAR